ncbi:MAG: cob(I)yrinic acid a,c-diamide adenosyltransferase [Bacteroidetes bacterium]|nr:cob(I)yrinic acid a,c-diamide adenosyltransferase [Bacteroidota bacterium]MBU1718399.1 cob(I)yrinic acid a,c-diamide adenosyltransferase [Bacteroidota bacterium]
MKVYTKTGDKGETSLIGGSRVPKYDLRIEAYGTVDELNAFVGLIRDHEIPDEIKTFLDGVQQKLFVAESLIALEPDQSKHTYKFDPLPGITESDIAELEQMMDKMNEMLPELRSFILPGGHLVVSYCHVARTVCRRAERAVLRVNAENQVDAMVVKYLNRLSDYFFVLARFLCLHFGCSEIKWLGKTEIQGD